MSSTTTTLSPEEFCKDFAAKFPTPKVQEAIQYGDAGIIEWPLLARLFADSLNKAIEVVQ